MAAGGDLAEVVDCHRGSCSCTWKILATCACFAGEHARTLQAGINAGIAAEGRLAAAAQPKTRRLPRRVSRKRRMIGPGSVGPTLGATGAMGGPRGPGSMGPGGMSPGAGGGQSAAAPGDENIVIKVDEARMPNPNTLRAHLFPSSFPISMDGDALKIVIREAFPNFAPSHAPVTLMGASFVIKKLQAAGLWPADATKEAAGTPAAGTASTPTTPGAPGVGPGAPGVGPGAGIGAGGPGVGPGAPGKAKK